MATPVYFLPQRALGPFVEHLTVEEVATDDLEITQHPVQDGAAITDHAFKKPAAVTIQAVFGPDSAPLAETYARLLALQDSRVPFDVITGKRSYRNMLLKGLRQTTDRETERVLAIAAELQEIRIVTVETVTVPERAKQADPARTGETENAGKKQAQEVTEGSQRRRSALAVLAGG